MPMMRIRDVSLFVKVMGAGDPLVLMHGGPGLDHTTLSSLEPLAEQFTLVFYDHRCNGRSTGAVESMTWDNLVADADSLRAMLGFDRWSVLGHSFGGLVAFEYALRHPERLSRLLVLDSCADARVVTEGGPDILAKRGYGDATVRAARRFYNGALEPKEVNRIIFRFLGAYFYRMRVRDLPHATVAAMRIRQRQDAHVFGFTHLYRGWSVMDRLKEIETPTLLLAGRYDFLSPAEHFAIVADRMPDARLEIIERAGHNAHDERAEQVIPIIREFLTTPEVMPSEEPAGEIVGV